MKCVPFGLAMLLGAFSTVLAADLTRGKDKVTVKFQAHAGNTAGGVFGCQMLKAEAGGK